MRDSRGRSARPRPISAALDRVLDQVSPDTPLAAVQRTWEKCVGAQVASVTKVIDEIDGVVTVECEAAVWAQELEMMAPQILSRLNLEMGGSGPRNLRFRVSGG